MNLYLDIEHFDIKNVFYNKAIDNKIKYYNYFYRILYNDKKYTIKNLLFEISSNNFDIIENKVILSYYIIDKIIDIEKKILHNINMIFNKKIELSIGSEYKNKIYIHNQPKLNNIILRISGIWESYQQIGLSYKIIIE